MRNASLPLAAQARAPVAKKKKRLAASLLGMGAEMLFAGGLILVGFLLSLLSGW